MQHVLTTGGGIVLVGAILWEVFADLFHPGDRAALSDWIGKRLFRLLRRTPRLFPLAGPLGVLAIVAVWVCGLVIGFALIYAGSFPDQFRTATETVPRTPTPFLSMIYFSFETLITLGYGDLVPRSFPMRIASNVEALIGFGILTASVSEIVLLYPALSRMRLLARGVAHLVTAEARVGVHVPQSRSEVILTGLARDVTQARIDLMHFPMVYYFGTHDPDASVARWTRQLCRLAEEGLARNMSEPVRLAAAALDEALTDLARVLSDRFVKTEKDDRNATFDAFAADHRVHRA